MEELRIVLMQVLNETLVQIILSNSRDVNRLSKVRIRPVMIGDQILFQETRYQGTKVFHENLNAEEMTGRICRYMEEQFRQCEINGGTLDATVLVSKKGKFTVKTRKKAAKPGDDPKIRLAHNREKHYILPDGEPVDFLIGLGVQTPDGHISKNRYDKFRQINRYLEFISDVLEHLPGKGTLHIVDFGCGKSYLTFAMYYYLHVKEGRDLRVTGLDLKEDVIRDCNELARKLHYDGLTFEQGDISTYEGVKKADMVVSLHACDTATDYAIQKAVQWGAEVILAVPCCQHEMNRQIHSDILKPALQYGIIRERIAALLTDAVRARLLEINGYDTQILEFIDMEHTPKNLLIRAVKSRKISGVGAAKGLREMEEFLHIDPLLEKLLKDEDKPEA